MKARWAALALRLDALTLRERVFLLLSVMACCMALVDLVWLSPAQSAHRQLQQRFERQSEALHVARSALTTVAVPADTTQTLRDDWSVATTRLDQVNRTIASLTPAQAQAPLAQAMVHLLKRHAGLTLQRAAAVPPAQAVAAGGTGVSNIGDPAGLIRQGVELTVVGPYPDLIRYVQSLETALPQARWGAMKLQSEQQPPELTLQLFLLNVQP